MAGIDKSSTPENMDEYQEAKGVRSGNQDDLYRVAFAQKLINYCVLAYFVGVGLRLWLPQELGYVGALIVVGAALTGLVSVVMLVVCIHGPAVGMLLGVLCLVPCVGLIVLLAASTKATGILRQNGIRVGLLGADLAEVREQTRVAPTDSAG